MKLLITGASGKLGRLAAAEALARVDPHDLILTTRTPEQLTGFADRGVEVREVDFDRPETLATAFSGAERMLLISTDALGRREAQHRAAIDAAVAAGVKLLAY